MTLSIVGVVLATEFGDELTELAARMPVWIVDTPVNRAAAEQLRADRPRSAHIDGVTTFKVDRGGTAEAWLVRVLSDVDLHHGHYSHDPPFSAIELYGASPTSAICETLAEFGLIDIVERPGGFVATRVSFKD